MKKIVIIAFVLLTVTNCFSQSVAVNSTGTAADTSAMLDVTSNTKGFLPPRMTTAQRTSIILPANGLIVFDTDTKSLWIFSVTWKEMINSTASNLVLPYTGTETNAEKLFSVTNLSTVTSSTAIFGKSGSLNSGAKPAYVSGIWGDSRSGIGITGTGFIGVSGIATGVFPNSAAIHGLSIGGNSITHAIVGELDNTTIGGHAGYFINKSPNHYYSLVKLLNKGTGKAIEIDINNTANNSAGLSIVHYGTGSLIEANAEANNFIVDNNTNIITSGAITVKKNKGIVRSSTSDQLILKSISSTIINSSGLNIGQSLSYSLLFGTTYSSPPVISVANLNSGFTGPCDKLLVSVSNVTTTGCTFRITNPHLANTGAISASWNLIVMVKE
jgi:hypothetical protein